jgi:alkylation response protein AidB-like acyl-CoA dehydrogenase
MDFAFSEEEEAFRADLRAYLDVELPDWWRGMFVDDERAMPFTREMCRALAERGWLTLAWPVEHGGAAAGVWMQTILREEMWAREEPRGPQYMNLNYIGPLIMRFGTPEQRDRFLPPMARGEVIWTQGFSEPDAGSDLASLATRAEDRGDHYVVNGQKIWSSYADAPADWCLLLVRTDAQGHRSTAGSRCCSWISGRRGSPCVRSAPWPARTSSTSSSSTMSSFPATACSARRTRAGISCAPA